MKTIGFSEEQIIGFRKQAEAWLAFQPHQPEAY